MPRPMTAEDRHPQVGDVLENPGYTKPARVKAVRFHGFDVGVFVNYDDRRAMRNWSYFSRADGGPVTVGEGE